jgi:hypothetical protein
LRLVILPLEVSVNPTVRGAVPEVGLASKLAPGGGTIVTATDFAVTPPGPVAVKVYVVVASGFTVILPVVGKEPPGPGAIMTVVASVVAQSSTTAPPLDVMSGVAEKLTMIGNVGVTEVTETVTWRAAVPLAPVAVKV